MGDRRARQPLPAGSELNLPRLEEAGVEFVAATSASPATSSGCGAVDALIECSAEPSVMSGVDGDTALPSTPT